ncbi:coproporphyrinogen III oxidase [Infundibulicybe gibba]|nr:coproporphyrinogen III oxidase [Infundibulicybe gibba]
MGSSMRQQVESFILELQNDIVSAFEKLDPTSPPFHRDSWVRPQGGSGHSCVFPPPSSYSDPGSTANSILEKAGINISIVHGNLPPAAIKQMRADHTSMPLPDHPGGLPFFAAGISLVVHPRNPHAPTVHANYRYFEITAPGDAPQQEILAWWFGGGSDLTPSYLYPADAAHFHTTIKRACEEHSPVLYPAFKTWCDEYFYIPHRGEARGIGGIFFDDLNSGPHARLPPDATRPADPASIFALMQTLGRAFLPSYLPILSARHSNPSTPEERRWQLLRRGRYVEFNLIYDRGTKFGLATPGARIESILMSLPETARWEYCSDLGDSAQGTPEAELVDALKNPRDWAE